MKELEQFMRVISEERSKEMKESIKEFRKSWQRRMERLYDEAKKK